METSAPKRRRTSPRTAVAVGLDDAPRDATPEPTPRGASPTKSPRRKRPDFASPTKASLARHNPEILARRRSEVEQRRASEQRRKSQEASVAEPQSAGSRGGVDDPASSRPGSRESDVSLSELLTAQRPDAGPRRTPIKPTPFARPLPPPAPEGEELVDPFTRRDRIRRSNQGQEDEPELPPTPSELGIGEATSTPPAGIHSESSPLKRRLAERERRRAAQLSSPLKKGVTAVREESPSPVDRLVNPQAEVRGGGAAHPARGVPADGEIAEKEEYLETLRREEESLWSDLKLMAGLGRQWAVQGGAGEVLPLVKRHPSLLPQPEEEPDASDDSFKALLQGAMDPSSWLTLPNPPQPETQEPQGPPPTSHHPIPMTAAEELPFLQIFTPFTVTTTGTPLSQPDMTSNTRRHTISLRAADYPPLFSAQLTLAVDLSDFSIADLKVPRLDPNAEAELRPFVEDLLIRTDRAVGRNVALVCWGMGEWYRLAVRRAAFWRELYAEMRGAVGENVEALWRRRGAVIARGVEESVDERLVGVKPGTAGDLLPHMGTTAATVPLPLCGEGVMVRIRWGISFDWVGDAQSKVDVAVGVPGHWHKGDPKGALAGIPAVFDEIVQGTRDVKGAVRRVIALLADREG